MSARNFIVDRIVCVYVIRERIGLSGNQEFSRPAMPIKTYRKCSKTPSTFLKMFGFFFFCSTDESIENIVEILFGIPFGRIG